MHIIISILCFFMVGLQANAIDEDNDYFKIYHAAVKAQKGDVSGIKQLISFSSKTKSPELSATLVKFVVLGMLKSKSKSLSKYLKRVKPAHIAFLEDAPLRKNCLKCEGNKVYEEQCRQCKKGICRGCRGTGQIKYEGFNEMVVKVCPSCKGSKECIKCDGTSTEKKDCLSCRKTGTFFDRKAIPAEYKDTLAAIIQISPELAFDEGLYIGVGKNKILLAATEAVEKEKRLAKLEARRALEKQQEVARSIREQQQVTKIQREKPDKIYVVREAKNSQEDIDRATLEMRNYLKNQERSLKVTLFETIAVKVESGSPTLYIEVSSSLMSNSDDSRKQYFEGFKRFWELRARNNGLAGRAQINITRNGKRVN